MSCKAANLCIANRYGQVLVPATMDAARPVTAGEVTLGLFGISREEFIPWAGGVPACGTVGFLSEKPA